MNLHLDRHWIYNPITSQLGVKVNIQFVSAIFDISVLVLVEIAQHA